MVKKYVKEWKWIALGGFLIILIALFLRLYNLTILPVFADEAIYIRWSQIMANEPTLRFLPLSDGKQPFFMWALMFLVHRFSDPLFIGRLVSVGTGIGTLVGIFALTYCLFKNKLAALVASLIWAISPFSIFFDRMALVDSMLTMFGVCTLFWGVVTAKTKRLDMALFTGFSLGAALLTKSPALFYVILLPTTWLLTDWPKNITKRALQLTKLVVLLVVTYTLAYGIFNILRLGPNFHLLANRNQDYVFPLSHLWTNPKDPFIFYFDRAFEWIRMMGPFMVLVLVLVGAVVSFKKYWKQILLLFIWFIFPIAVQAMFAKTFTARYILFSIPALYILASVGFTAKKKLVKYALVIFLITFSIHALWFDHLLLINPEAAPLPRSERSGYLEEWTAGTGIREVSELIKTEHENNPEKEIVVGTEGYFGTLPDGLQIYLDGMPNVIVIGVGLDFVEVPSQLLDSVKAGNKTYFVLNSSRMKFENPKELGLIEIASFKKADRPYGLREYVVHGPYDTFYLFEVTEDAVERDKESN